MYVNFQTVLNEIICHVNTLSFICILYIKVPLCCDNYNHGILHKRLLPKVRRVLDNFIN